MVCTHGQSTDSLSRTMATTFARCVLPQQGHGPYSVGRLADGSGGGIGSPGSTISSMIRSRTSLGQSAHSGQWLPTRSAIRLTVRESVATVMACSLCFNCLFQLGDAL